MRGVARQAVAADMLRASIRFVDEYEVLVHSLGIGGALEHKQVLRADDAMLGAGPEMELVARREHPDGERLPRAAAGQDQASTFLHFEAFILFLVRLQGEVSALADD